MELPREERRNSVRVRGCLRRVQAAAKRGSTFTRKEVGSGAPEKLTPTPEGEARAAELLMLSGIDIVQLKHAPAVGCM
eukprot:scaffold242035_cov30-Tisochrysis_lutea.AAC.1